MNSKPNKGAKSPSAFMVCIKAITIKPSERQKAIIDSTLHLFSAFFLRAVVSLSVQ